MAEDVSIFQEIDEAMRVEKLEQFWHRHGKSVLIGCALIVLATVASVLWKDHLRAEHERQTSLLLQAVKLTKDTKYQEAMQAFAKTEETPSRLATLARIRQGQAQALAGEKQKAHDTFSEAARDTKAEDTLRDYAAIEASLTANDPKQADADLVQAGAEGHPYASMAQEMEAASLLQAGKTKEAAAKLKPITEDLNVPMTQRQRVTELLNAAGGAGK